MGTMHLGIQRSLFVEINRWHWTRSVQRQSSLRDFLEKTVNHGEVWKWAINAVDSFPDDERIQIIRHLLQRNDCVKCEEFIQILGRWLGARGMVVFADGQRSALVALVRDILTDPTSFALVKDEAMQRDLLTGLAWGMEEQVQGNLQCDSVIRDFADWLGQIIQRVRGLAQPSNRQQGVLPVVLHFLEADERKGIPMQVAKPWWDALFPLLQETIQNADVDEVWMMLFDQRRGVCNDLAAIEEVFDLVQKLVDRIADGLINGGLDVHFRSVDKGPRNTWADCADLAAEWLVTLLDAGRLKTDASREKCFQLLQNLSTSPFNSEKALQGIYRFQNGNSFS